ncbi:lipoprotein [Halomonas sp. Bachu 37]
MPRRAWLRVAPLAMAVMLLAACGQKGPLYLPDPEPADQRPAAEQET